MSIIIEALGSGWEKFWQEIEKRKRETAQETWRCDKCGREITFNPCEIYVGGSPRTGWIETREHISVAERLSTKKRPFHRFCSVKCMKEFDFGR